MFDHVVFGVRDYAVSKAFFLEALEPLGVAVVSEGPLGIELGRPDGKSSLCIRRIEGGLPTLGRIEGGLPTLGRIEGDHPGHLHLAFTAESRAQVDAFHRAALAAGGKDNGAPGLRPQYHANYYAAFVTCPDGHNIEAVCHEPDAQP